jgi:hypothetical protein
MHTPLTEQNLYGHLMTIKNALDTISTLPRNKQVLVTLEGIRARI